MTQSGKRDSVFVRAFGDLGDLIQFFVGFLALLGVLMVGIPLLARLPTMIFGGGKAKPEPPADTTSVLGQVRDLQERTQRVLASLDRELERSQNALREREATLLDMIEKVDSLELTPGQAAIVQRRAAPLGFLEWISRRPVWYDIIVSFIIALFFYWLGRRTSTRTREGVS